MTTIYDIARATGYSAPTVSRALNGTGFLRAKTRKEITTVAQELGYTPNITARSLATKCSHLIGVIYEDIQMMRGFSHPVFGGLLNAFRKKVESAGYDIIFISDQASTTYKEHTLYRRVDGLVAINIDDREYDKVHDMAQWGVPCVSTNPIIPGVCTILTNNVSAGRRAGEYLLRKGHKKIAFLAGPGTPFITSSAERLNGLQETLAAAGIRVDDNLVEVCNLWTVDSGREGFLRLWKKSRDFTALFAASDLLAFGAMRAAAELGIKIPEDVSIVGFDGDNASAFCRPSLTTFRQDSEALADMAAEMLMQRMAGLPTVDVVRVDAEFIERDSVMAINR